MKLEKLFSKTDKTQMTIIEALSKVTLLNKRIDKQISNCKLYSLQGKLIQQPSEQLQSIEDLISLLGRIKSAIIVSNATTTININGTDMLVCQAIVLRDTLMDKLDSLRRQISYQYDDMLTKIEASKQEAMRNAGDRNGKELENYMELMTLKNLTRDDLNLEQRLAEYEDLLASLNDIENKLNISNISTTIEV